MGWGGARGAAIAVATLLTVTAGCTAAQQRAEATSSSAPAPSSSAGSSTPSPLLTSSSTRPGASSPAPPAMSTTGTRTTAPSAAATRETPPPSGPVVLPAGVAEEASGLTPTGHDNETFWTVDDASGTDSLIAIDDRGRRIGSLQVEGMSAGNAEAVSAGACTAGSAVRCLFVGDLGDHVGRDHVTIYRVPEPTAAAGNHHADGTAWRYTYSDGARNAESMLVTPDGSLVVIDKPQRSAGARPPAHHVYRGPPGGGVLTLVGTFTPPTPADPLQSLIEGNVATDAALQLGPAGTRVLIQFYDQVLQYTAPRRAADPATFFRWPHVALPAPELIQAEGIAPLADGCGFASISEAGPVGSAAQLSIAACR